MMMGKKKLFTRYFKTSLFYIIGQDYLHKIMVAKYVMFIHFTDLKVEKCGNLEAESTTQKKPQTKKKNILNDCEIR